MNINIKYDLYASYNINNFLLQIIIITKNNNYNIDLNYIHIKVKKGQITYSILFFKEQILIKILNYQIYFIS